MIFTLYFRHKDTVFMRQFTDGNCFAKVMQGNVFEKARDVPFCHFDTSQTHDYLISENYHHT